MPLTAVHCVCVLQEWMQNDHGGETLISRWRKRQEYLDSVTRAHESRFAAARLQQQSKGAGTGQQQHQQQRRSQSGRRLRSEPILYLLNCSRVWRGEAGMSKAHAGVNAPRAS